MAKQELGWSWKLVGARLETVTQHRNDLLHSEVLMF